MRRGRRLFGEKLNIKINQLYLHDVTTILFNNDKATAKQHNKYRRNKKGKKLLNMSTMYEGILMISKTMR